jgi:thymidylate synthase
MYLNYNNAQDAFENLYEDIMLEGEDRSGTKSLHSVAFNIINPLDNLINTPWRKWNKSYAELEWQWYLSGNPNADEISKHAKIWKSLVDDNGNVNSNYGYQWKREDQLEKVIKMLIDDKYTRRASISLYDGKEINLYAKDTICTYAINFYISYECLNMQVIMRSNDLVYGFCNDQYCFSKLQEFVANRLNLSLGIYSHYACNMHIYEKHYNLKP